MGLVLLLLLLALIFGLLGIAVKALLIVAIVFLLAGLVTGYRSR